MKISKTIGVWLSAVAFVVTLSSGRPTNAQVLITGRTASDNAASAGGRAPGSLATAGVGRAIQAARDGRSVHTITEQESTSTGPTGQFIASAGTTLVTQVFDFFFFFVNRFLERGGLAPIFPGQLTLPTTGDTTGDGNGSAPTTGAGGDTSGTETGGTTEAGDTTDGGSGDATGSGTEDTTGSGNGDTVDAGTEDTGETGGTGTTGGRRPVRKTAASIGR